MASAENYVPLIDVGRYISPTSAEDKTKLIEEVRDALTEHGFLAIKGHGVPLQLQRTMIECIRTLMDLPAEEKMELSLKKRVCRRGYEGNGDQLQHPSILPDAKEGFYIAQEEPEDSPITFLRGPNVWPNLPEEKFKGPVWEYYLEMVRLGRVLWEILVQGLGHPVSVLESFTKHPAVIMKLIRYPPHESDDPRQFGAGPHTDFGGVTCLLQQPGKDALEVWNARNQRWIPIPAVEDVYVINLGDMVQKWTDGKYKSTKHRVLNKTNGERISCATFWQGDLDATSPLDPSTKSDETVEQYIVRHLAQQFKLPEADKEKIGGFQRPDSVMAA